MRAGVARPQPWALGGAPRTITLLTAVDAEPVANQDALLAGLHDLGSALGFRVRPYSVSTRAPCLGSAARTAARAGPSRAEQLRCNGCTLGQAACIASGAWPAAAPSLTCLLLARARTAAAGDARRALGRADAAPSAGAPFPSFVAAMARTGVLVSRHGPLLANAAFLPPGAAHSGALPGRRAASARLLAGAHGCCSRWGACCALRAACG